MKIMARFGASGVQLNKKLRYNVNFGRFRKFLLRVTLLLQIVKSVSQISKAFALIDFLVLSDVESKQ